MELDAPKSHSVSSTDPRERSWRIMGELREHGVGRSLRSCRLYPSTPGATVQVRSDGTRARFSGLQCCSSPWACPICAHAIGATRAQRASDALARLGLPWATGVMTVAHHKGQRLVDTLTAVQESWSRVWSGRHRQIAEELGVYAVIRGTEVTYSDVNGWHPHLHMIVVMRDGGNQAHRDQVKDQVSEWLQRRWVHELKRHGMTASWQGNGALHWPRDADRAVQYLFKAAALDTLSSATKTSHPFALLEAGRYELWREYECATRGRRQSGYVWRERLQLQDDNDAEDVHQLDDAPVVAELHHELWREVRRQRCEVGLLHAIERRDAWTIDVLALTAHTTDARMVALFNEIASRWHAKRSR